MSDRPKRFAIAWNLAGVRLLRQIKAGEGALVLGCGPVGLFAQKAAFLLGAERVIAVDHVAYRLEFAASDTEAAPRLFADQVRVATYRPAAIPRAGRWEVAAWAALGREDGQLRVTSPT